MEGKLNIEEYKQIHVFRAVQEIINNAVKYSEAQTVSVNTNYADGLLEVRISDDGKGFDRQVIEQHKLTGIGLKNIEGRMKLIQASCKLMSGTGSGTTYVLRIPAELD